MEDYNFKEELTKHPRRRSTRYARVPIRLVNCCVTRLFADRFNLDYIKSRKSFDFMRKVGHNPTERSKEKEEEKEENKQDHSMRRVPCYFSKRK